MNETAESSNSQSEPLLMVLEDNDIIGEQFLRWLKIKFPERKARRARSIAEAQSLISEFTFDFFLLDILLPDGNGIDFLCDLKIVTPSARVIVMTATPLPEFRDKAMSLGTIRFMEKPVDLAVLERELRQHISAKHDQPVAPVVAVPVPAAAPYAAAQGVQAVLESITLLDLIQLKCLGRCNTTLEFVCPDGSKGSVYLRNGQIVHAETPDRMGVEALHRILSWHHGCVHENRRSLPPEEPTIDGDWQMLLMEAAQAIDEGRLSP